LITKERQENKTNLVLVRSQEVILLQCGDRLVFAGGNGDTQRVGERCTLERFNLGAESSREEECPALTGENLQDLIQNRTEIHVKKSVGFVHTQVLQAAERESLCVLEVIEETTRGRDDDVGLLS
jgi:hypothetical protein